MLSTARRSASAPLRNGVPKGPLPGHWMPAKAPSRKSSLPREGRSTSVISMGSRLCRYESNAACLTKNKRAYNYSMHIMDLGTFALRLGIALILGTVVGLERQYHHRMAGTRTNALVSVAAAAFAMIGISLSETGSDSRVIGQIVSGVGFLGAGVIFKEGGTVHGLNTAATIWCSAAVGALAGISVPLYAGN